MFKKACVVAVTAVVLSACHNDPAGETVGKVGHAVTAVPDAVVEHTAVSATDHMLNQWNLAEDVVPNKYPNRLPGTRF